MTRAHGSRVAGVLPVAVGALVLALPATGATEGRPGPEGEPRPEPSLQAKVAGGMLEVSWRTATDGAWLLRMAGSCGGPPALLACGIDLRPGVHSARWPIGSHVVESLELSLVQRQGVGGGGPLLRCGPVRPLASPRAATTSQAASLTVLPAQPPSLVPFHILSCSLGCSWPVGQISCAVVHIAQNQDLALSFSLPVDLSSVGPQSFRIFDVGTGTAPTGTFFLQPGDPSRLVFRPSLTFDPQGQPHFGFQGNASYRVFLPGVAQGDPGPFVQSNAKVPNQQRMLCTVTSNGLIDWHPGPPSVSVLVDVVTAYNPSTGLPSSFAYGVPASGATNVWVESDITFAFDEIMAPATLLDLTTGQSSTFQVLVDTDGDLTTTGDRVPQPGVFSFDFDLLALTSRLVFDPTPALPHAGGGPSPLKIVVEVPASATDLVGNPLSNPGSQWFVPER